MSASQRPLVLAVGGAGLALSDALHRLREHLDARGVAPKARHASVLAFEELVVNVIRHAGIRPAPGDEIVCATVDIDADAVRLRFEDRGAEFDPTAVADPLPPASIETAPIGGLGIPLVRRSVDRLVYTRVGGRNRVEVTVANR